MTGTPLDRPTEYVNLRERVSIEAPTTTQDEIGASTTTFATVAQVWAKVTPVTLREQTFSERAATFGFYLVVIRYRNDISYDLQIVWRGKTLNVVEVKNVDERRQFLTLLCRDANPNTGTVP